MKRIRRAKGDQSGREGRLRRAEEKEIRGGLGGSAAFRELARENKEEKKPNTPG
jgi:hypothetical protein